MNAMLVVVVLVLVVGGPQRPFESWLDASHSFELLFRGKDKEGIPYRPDLQPPPPSELGGQRSDQLDPHGPLSATGLNQLLTASETEMMRGGVSLSSS